MSSHTSTSTSHHNNSSNPTPSKKRKLSTHTHSSSTFTSHQPINYVNRKKFKSHHHYNNKSHIGNTNNPFTTIQKKSGISIKKQIRDLERLLSKRGESMNEEAKNE